MASNLPVNAAATHVNGHTPRTDGENARLQIIDDEKEFK
jgi:hypothetical protein